MAHTNDKIVTRAAITIIFLLSIFVPFFGTIFSEKYEISLNEQRRLASFPKIAWNMSELSAFPKSLEGYLRDHFFFREKLVLFNALLRVKLVDRSPTFVVIVGSKGWYYFIGDWALHDYLGITGKTGDEVTRNWEQAIIRHKQWVQDMGGQYLLAIVPNKEKIYPEFLPDRIRDIAGTTMLEALHARMQGSDMADHFLDLTASLRREKECGDVYHMSDSHWNSRGAYAAYLALIQRIRLWFPEVVPLSEDRLVKRPQQSRGGDLTRLMGIDGSITESIEDWAVKDPCFSPQDRVLTSPLLSGTSSLMANGCSEAAALRVLVISDSFGDALHGYLAETFKEIVFSRELDLVALKPFITEYRPDLILHLHVGRYMEKALDNAQ